MTPLRKYVFVILEYYKTHIDRNSSQIYTHLMELLRAEIQAILMNVFATLKQRGHNGVITIVDALRLFLATKKNEKSPITADSAE